MKNVNQSIYIISDIEGSSGCLNYEASSFMTVEWARACIDMSKDIDVLVRALFDAGVKTVTVKDFHRTGYNLYPEMIDPRARIISGYVRKPVPGMGLPPEGAGLMLVGMHASSGSGGFLAHTFTSRIGRLEVNGRSMPEFELFSSAVAPHGLRPIFFSGCPVACAEASLAVKNIRTYPIDKKDDPCFNKDKWRMELAAEAVKSIDDTATKPYSPRGPFNVRMHMRDGEEAAGKLARRWKLQSEGDIIEWESADMISLYETLARLCYLTPLLEKILPAGLPLYNAIGSLGQSWARRKINTSP